MKKQEAHVNLLEISINNDYVTGNILDCLYHQKYYKLIGINYSRQRYTSIPPTNKFCKKIRRRWCCNNVFFSWKEAKNILDFL